MPTLYTALLAHHGAMPKPKIEESIATEKPSHIVFSLDTDRVSGNQVVVIVPA